MLTPNPAQATAVAAKNSPSAGHHPPFSPCEHLARERRTPQMNQAMANSPTNPTDTSVFMY